MFYGRMEYMTLAKPVTQTDRLNFKTSKMMEEVEDIRIYVIRNNQQMYQTNELNLRLSQFTGYTEDMRPDVGWIVGGKFIVTDVQRGRHGLVLSLSSLGDSANLLVEATPEPTQVEAKMAWVDLHD